MANRLSRYLRMSPFSTREARCRALLAVLFAALHTPVEDAAAQSAYPSKPVRIIVPFPAGGTTDIVARGIAQLMSGSWGQQVIVDNRAGASGAIGAAAAAQAPPDGYTLVMASTAILAINPHLRRNLPYNVRRDFAPVSLAVVTPNLLAVHPSLPVRSVKDLLELAKAKPDGIIFGSSGTGSVGHLALEQFRTLGGVRMLHVPYKGALPAEVDLLAGHIAVMASGMVSVLPHVKSGRVRALAVTSAKRTPLLPEVPAVAEVLPGFDAGAWFGVLAPAGTPAPIIEQLHRAIAVALRTPELRVRLSGNGAEVVGSSPQEFQRYIAEESERYGRLLREAGIAQGK